MSWNNTKGFANWAGNSNFVLPSNLVVSSIQTNFISTGRINVSSIYTNVLNASSIYTNLLKASTISTIFLNASTINTNALNASSIYTNYISSGNADIKNLNTSSIYTNFLNASSISTKFITSEVGYFSTIYVDDIIGLSTSINVISFSTITRSLAVDNISRFEQPFITFNSDVVIKNDLNVKAISTNHISSGSISTGSILADILKGNISTNSLVVYSSEEQSGSIGFTDIDGSFVGGINGDAGILSILAVSNLGLFSLQDIGILSYGDMYTAVSTNYVFSAGGVAGFEASNILLNSYGVNISTSLNVVNSTITDSLYANTISTGSFITSNINVLDISCNNITISNATDANILNVGGQTTLNGATTANQDIFVNADINMKYDTLETDDPLFLPPYEYYQKDITNARNINCASLTVIGGATSNTEIGIFVPPFHYNSVVTIGNEDGITCPGVVTINGQNPGFGENITNALTVRGDMAVDFGVLTTYNGLVCEPFDVEANAIEVNGIAEFNGLVNIIGVDVLGLSVEGGVDIVGYANVGGVLAVEGIANLNGGTEIIGGLDQNLGDITLGLLGSEYSTTINCPLTVNETTSFNGNVTMNADLDMADHDILNVRNLNVSTLTSVAANLSTLRLFNLSTNNIILYPDGEFPVAIAFSDLSANLLSVITQANDTFSIVGTSSIQIAASNILGLGAEGNVGIGSTYSNISINAASTLSHTAGCNITLFATDSIAIESADAGIALVGETVVAMNNNYDTSFLLNLDNIIGNASTNMTFTAGSNINLNSSTFITFNSLSNINFNTPTQVFVNANLRVDSNVVYAGGVQTDTLFTKYINGSSNITLTTTSNININSSTFINFNSLSNINFNTPTQVFVNANLRVDSNVVYAGGVETETLYTESINTPASMPSLTFVNVFKDFDMGDNNIINVTNVRARNITAAAVSTTTISTNSITTGTITAPVNLNIGKSIIPFGGLANSDIGASGGFRWNRLWVSTISSIAIQTSTLAVQTTLQASTIQVNRLQALTDSGTITGNLYPVSGSAFIGYGSNTAQGGFYAQGTFVSTFTRVLHPSLDSGAFSNNIRIQGNVSTQNVFVSTINRKQYPCRSTIGGPSFPSSFSIDGSTSATPQLLISSINFFAGVGTYDISQRMVWYKETGGTSVDAHGSILVASTNSLVSPFIDSNFGYGQVPQVNDVGHSTFTTMVTSVNIGANSFQRQYKYLDATGGNYTGRLYLERPVITYIPSFGLNPE